VTLYDGTPNLGLRNVLDRLAPEEKGNISVHPLGTVCNRGGLIETHGAAVLPLGMRCRRPEQQLCINYKGEVVLCCNDYLGLVKAGSLWTDSVQTLWRSQLFTHYRTLLRSGERGHLKLCKDCDLTE